MVEQAVIVHLRLSDNSFGTAKDRRVIEDLEDAMERVVEQSLAGEFDGDEFGQGECVMYLYGPDADVLFSVIEELLKSCELASGGFAIKRYGDDADAKSVRVSW